MKPRTKKLKLGRGLDAGGQEKKQKKSISLVLLPVLLMEKNRLTS